MCNEGSYLFKCIFGNLKIECFQIGHIFPAALVNQKLTFWMDTKYCWNTSFNSYRILISFYFKFFGILVVTMLVFFLLKHSYKFLICIKINSRESNYKNISLFIIPWITAFNWKFEWWKFCILWHIVFKKCFFFSKKKYWSFMWVSFFASNW